MRWAEFLSRFNFRITYRPGRKAILPDALSRLPGVKLSHTDDRLGNRCWTLLPMDHFDPSLLKQLIKESQEQGDLAPITIDIDTAPLTRLIDTAYLRNDVAQQVMSALRDPECRRSPENLRKIFRTYSEWSTIDGKAYFRHRLFIPDNDELRAQIIWRTHSSGPGGHPGRVKTLDLMNRTYWWPRMSQDVSEFVKACQLCFRTKTPRSAPPRLPQAFRCTFPQLV